MNCFNHTSEPAITQCLDCKKGLCSNCTTDLSIPLCESCKVLKSNFEKRKIFTELLLTFGVGILLTYFMIFQKVPNNKNINISFVLLTFYFNSGIVPGWKALSNILPKMEFRLTIPYFVYFLIKLFGSLFIGIFVLPISTYNNIYKLIKMNKDNSILKTKNDEYRRRNNN